MQQGCFVKIAYIASSYSPFLNGVSFAVHRRVRWLLQRGHRVHLFRPNADEQFPQEVHQRAMPGLAELQAFPDFSDFAYPSRPHPFSKTYPVPRSHRHWRIDEHLEAFKPDIVVLEDLPSLIGYSSPFGGGYRRYIASNYARRVGIPTLALAETDWLSYAATYFGRATVALLRPLLRPEFRRMSSAYDLQLFPSDELLERNTRFGVVNARKLHFHGVLTDEYRPENVQFDPIPNDPRPTLLFIGRLVPEKSVLDLMAAFAHIHESLPEAHLVIIGSGPLESVLRKRAHVFGSAVTFPGEAYGDTLKGWYARADLFLNPSTSETFCTTNLEALASGTPVIAAAGGGHFDQIQSGHNGFLVRPHDPRDMAQQALSLLTDPERLAKSSKQARESVLSLDWHRCCERFESVMLQLIEEKRGDHPIGTRADQ